MDIRPFSLDESHRSDLEYLLFELSGEKRVLNLDTHHNVYCVGAFDGERLVGFAQLFLLPKTTFIMGYLEDVIVHSEYRNQGIGTKILTEVISLATQKGAKVINLTTRVEREAAVNLFHSLGFTSPGNIVLRLPLAPLGEKGGAKSLEGASIRGRT